VIRVVDDQGRVLPLRLARPVERTLHRPSLGGALARDGEYAIVLDPGAFDGAPEQPLGVAHAWIEPGSGATPLAFETSDAGPTAVDLVAVAWIGDARTPDGELLPMTGTGTLRLSAPPGDPLRALAAPAVFHFDPASGLWEATAPATLEERAISGPIDGPGWWALGTDAPALGALGGAVTHDGRGVPGALVALTHPSRPAPLVAWADGEGRFCAPTVPDGALGATVTAQVLAATADDDARYGATVALPAADRAATGCDDAGQIQVGPVGVLASDDRDDDGFFGGAWGDCDDSDVGRSPAALDPEGDGFDENCDGTDGIDADRDGESLSSDCNDTDPAASHGSPEVCDGRNNDCDDQQDEGVAASVAVGEGLCVTCDAQAVIDLGPKLYWTFRELGRTTPDSSGYGLDGVVSGLDRVVNGVSDETGEAPYFAGTQDSFVALESFPGMGAEELTVSVFLRPSLGGRRNFFSYALPPPPGEEPGCGANAFGLGIHTNGVLLVVVRDFITRVGTDNQLPLHTWMHLAVTWRSDGRVEVFRDGEPLPAARLDKSEPGSECAHEGAGDTDYPSEPLETVFEPGGSVAVGQDTDGLFDRNVGGSSAGFDALPAFEGPIDEIAVFDRVLTEDEIRWIYEATTCGEGLVCDGEDDDGDGAIDEHLLGNAVTCPARSCEHIAGSDADVGDESYWISFDRQSVLSPCTFEDGDCSCRICGDGELQAPWESCDGGALPSPAECRECAIDPGTAPTDCAAVRDAGYTEDGVYWIQPLGAPAPQKIRCDQHRNGGGWNLVYGADAQAGLVFFDPADQVHTAVADAVEKGLVRDWRVANSSNPFGALYSILGQLEAFRGGCGFELRLEYPEDGQDLRWRQTSSPVDDPDVVGFERLAGDPWDVQLAFEGLHYCADTIDDQGVDYLVARSCGGFTELSPDRAVPHFAVAPYSHGVQYESAWAIPASPDVGDGTVRSHLLWVRGAECR
jgi:hypothetical protein